MTVVVVVVVVAEEAEVCARPPPPPPPAAEVPAAAASPGVWPKDSPEQPVNTETRNESVFSFFHRSNLNRFQLFGEITMFGEKIS